MVLDIDGNRLDATFLRNFGDIDDVFTIVKSFPAPSVKPSLEISRADTLGSPVR